MAFARWERPIVDGAGNIVPFAQVEVRREVPGFPLAVPLYADFDGDGGEDNPFVCGADGVAAFHAVGGFYKITIIAPGFSQVLRYQAIGTAQAADVDAYAKAGFTFAPESATASPPTAGCVRFSNGDVSLATHIYVSAATLGEADATAYLASFVVGDWLLGSTGVGIETGWPVLGVANHTTWFDFTIDQTRYVGPAGPLSLGDGGFFTLSRQPGVAASGTELVITTAGTTVVGAGVSSVVVNLASPGTVTLTLGRANARNNLPLVVSDFAGNATIVLNADAADTGGINGGASAQINSSGSGFGLAGGATFYPKPSLNGWIGIA